MKATERRPEAAAIATDLPQLSPGLQTVRAPRRSRWYVRVPLKLALFAAVTLTVLFPSAEQFRRHISHVLNLEKMVTPDAPELAAWDADLDRLRTKGEAQAAKAGISPAVAIQKRVERFVYERVRYEWDWNTWGSADYMPTVSEMFAAAKERGGELLEDCDGRAVMAASIMRRLGYEARIVTDFRHVWVETDDGAWMSPGRKPSVESTPTGNQTDILATISNIPVSLSYGIAVFPFWREFIIAAAAFLLLLHARSGRVAIIAGAVLIVGGLLCMRMGYLAPGENSRAVRAWPAWVGLAQIAIALVVLMRASHLARRRAERSAAGARL